MSSSKDMSAREAVGSMISPLKKQEKIVLERLDEEEQSILLQEAPWQDKTLWVAKMVLGGQSTNGFLKATSSLQRIKRQNARRLKKTEEANTAAGKKRENDQATEEVLKGQIMNVRIAKRMKAEMEAGEKYCEQVYQTIADIVQQLGATPPEPLDIAPRPVKLSNMNPRRSNSSSAIAKPLAATTSAPTPPPSAAAPGPLPPPPTVTMTAKSAASPGDPSGSSLRKNRRKKQPSNTENYPNIAETDPSGKRLMTKKEHTFRTMECLRFRMLRQGDLVAARPSSRDLWILARVTSNYPGNDNMQPLDFLSLTRAKRDQLFREKVTVQDVEDEGNTVAVPRSLILPLPRSKAEAADWGSRFKKGFRVYAMYPQTTSLYTATVVDNTTYYRGEDDIIVVQFDGDEPDATGQIPTCHIPASFVTLVPREFPGAQAADTANPAKRFLKKKSSLDSAKFSDAVMGVTNPAGADEMNALDMNFDAMSSLDDLDDLDFDLGLT